MTRRNWFAAVAAPFVAPAAPATSSAARLPAPGVTIAVADLVASSMRMIGVLLAGETPDAASAVAARFALLGLGVSGETITVPPRHLQALRFALARQLIPEFYPGQFLMSVRKPSGNAEA